MHERRLSPTDRLFSGIDTVLRGIAGPKARSRRPCPADGIPDSQLTPEQRRHAAGLMRVNHAGEVAAQGLYQGHAAVARSHSIAHHMREAAAEELDHLGWCEQRLEELGDVPSRLRPLWYAGSFAIGVASGALGDRWSLGFVEETERQVAEHLEGHLDRLPPSDARSRAIVERMRIEEQQHGARAKAAGAESLPRLVHRLMRLIAKVMTRTSYRI
ncbi:MAG TPA: 2-polyprenyl-3-methyl-6-methoxy-1,4-benzoquinone monooxygenase [Woeseiaceae bacterium]|nr:2-polyprenyl-3-methyl-6-methoxy-1,4-benzoquinone monooxygenase [Woeseiaceae bacterium]